MAHDARVSYVVLAGWMLISGCSGGGDSSDTGGPSAASPPGTTAPGSPPPGTTPVPPPPAATTFQTIVYQTFTTGGDSNLYLVKEDGSGQTALAITSQREHYRGMSLDGWAIYDRYVSDISADLVSVRLADGEMRLLDRSSDGKSFRGFAPDNRVIYQKNTATGGAIHSVRADGSATIVLIDAAYTTAEFVGVTSSGRVLYQACERASDPQRPPTCISTGLYSAAADGRDRQLLLSGRPRVALITSDERVIAETDVGGQTDIVSIAATGGNPVVLANSSDDESEPHLLPDGRILYARRVANQWDVYLVNADGTGNRALLTNASDEFVTGVTPAGRVLFTASDANGRRNLYAVDPDGTRLAVLGDSTDDENLRRVTNDGRIVYSTRRIVAGFAQDDLYSVMPDGTDLRILADSQEFEWFEDVAPDGRVIYMRCIAARGGPCEDSAAQSDLYSVRQDGVGTAAIATGGEFETFRAVSANNRVVYQRRRTDGQHDIESVSSDGTEPRTLANTPVDERYQGIQ